MVRLGIGVGEIWVYFRIKFLWYDFKDIYLFYWVFVRLFFNVLFRFLIEMINYC